MAAKAVLVLCAQALIIKFVSAQCVGPAYNAANSLAWEAAAGPYAGPAAWNAAPCAAGALTGPWAAAPLAGAPYANAEWAAAGYSPASLAASNGGGLAVTSASPIAPTGVAMTSENAYEGALAVSGALPFLGAIALEGALPTAGAGAVTYGCGNGNVAMLSEDLASTAFGYGPASAAAAADLAFGYPYGAPGAYEAGLVGPAYGGTSYGYRGCGCGAI